MEKSYEQKIIEVFGIKNYEATDLQKLALAELASQLFLVTDYELGYLEDKKENFNRVITELIGVNPSDEIPMSTLIATTVFDLSKDIFEQYDKAKIAYMNNQEQFDEIYVPVCEYAKTKYPEFKARQYRY